MSSIAVQLGKNFQEFAFDSHAYTSNMNAITYTCKFITHEKIRFFVSKLPIGGAEKPDSRRVPGDVERPHNSKGQET
jgi:hypothetical protein